MRPVYLRSTDKRGRERNSCHPLLVYFRRQPVGGHLDWNDLCWNFSDRRREGDGPSGNFRFHDSPIWAFQNLTGYIESQEVISADSGKWLVPA